MDELLTASLSPGDMAELACLVAGFMRAKTVQRAAGAMPALHPSPAGVPEALTSREREILRLIEAGMSNREIARASNIEVGTVKRHVHNILGKLCARNRAEAIARVNAQRATQAR